MKPEVGIWSDNIAEIMEKREIILANTESNEHAITNNRTIMDFAKVCIQEGNLEIKSLFPMNHV